MDVSTAMSRIKRADDEYPTEIGDRDQQYEMYEKTLEAVKDIDADDDDEGVFVVTTWIVEQLEETGERPSSKTVRSKAREFCRENGYDVSNNAWLGT